MFQREAKFTLRDVFLNRPLYKILTLTSQLIREAKLHELQFFCTTWMIEHIVCPRVSNSKIIPPTVAIVFQGLLK
jgi:hypothetical protein